MATWSRSEGARSLEHGVSAADREALSNIRRRKALSGSPLYRRLESEIDRITHGVEVGGLGRTSSRERAFFRAVSWNIERGNQLDDVLAFVQATPAIREADFLLLNEVDIGMARSGNRNVARELADALDMEYVFGNSYLCLGHGDVRDNLSGADGSGPGERPHNRSGLHGNAILSRFPFLRARNVPIFITKDKFESSDKRLGCKKALWAEVDVGDARLELLSVHPDPYASPRMRARQMSDALSAASSTAPCLVGGDWNTATYDLESIPRLFWNLATKMARGGLPHVLDHYMRPQDLYERPIFDAVRERGFEIEPFNALNQGTVRYEVGSFDSESKVREHLPGIFVSILRVKLAPYGGVAPLRVDWFAGRGIRPLAEAELRDDRECERPKVYERARHEGRWLSDHDPIQVDFVASGK